MTRQEVFPKMVTQASWLAPPECVMLNNDEVHVWRASLEMTPSQVKTMEHMLSADELSRAGKFYFQKDRAYFIAARGLLRTILGKYLLMQPDELRFCYGPFGKPALEEMTYGKALRFNASHSHGLALFSFALDQEIGVDLEYIRSDLSVCDLAEQFFSQREADTLNALAEHGRLQAFFTLWTRKEAYLKAQGKGLSDDLADIEVFRSPGDPAELIEINGPCREETPWVLRDLNVEPGYAAALAVEGHGWQLKCWQWKNS